MLKIKDSVDLKELEKFGFVRTNTMGENYYKKEYMKGFYKENILIWEEDRKIQCQAIQILFTLYDLIAANMVEKAEG